MLKTYGGKDRERERQLIPTYSFMSIFFSFLSEAATVAACGLINIPLVSDTVYKTKVLTVIGHPALITPRNTSLYGSSGGCLSFLSVLIYFSEQLTCL